jgi:glycine betaine/choline ABC-type transport system substrate-binding protein
MDGTPTAARMIGAFFSHGYTRMNTDKTLKSGGTTIVALLFLASCSHPAVIVVGSKNFTEQVLLGEILAQQIEHNLGVHVERRLNLGGTMLAHEALVKGSIDLYPEYTGTALTAILKRPPDSDRATVLETVRSDYRQKWKLEWLAPLGFIDTFAMMVRGETAKSAGLVTISDAARGQAWRLGAGYEFRQRPDGLDGFLKTYNLRTQGDPVSMDLGLLYTALQGRQVDMIAANSTDGLASVLDVTILQDDKHYFPPYECSVVLRQETLQRFPKLAPTLEQLSGNISDETMRKLNYQVDGKHRPVPEVAQEFLRTLPAHE